MALNVLWAIFFLLTFTTSAANSNWLNHGGDIYNRRYAKEETEISPRTVSKLQLKWKFYAGKDITATPAVYDETLYFPSWNGHIYAVKADDGSLVWEKNLEELTGLRGTGMIYGVNVTVSRSTPTVAGDILIFGIYGPAVVIAVERETGNLVWLNRLDSHNASLVTMSGTAYNGAFYVGTSSAEETVSADKCCTFRGRMAKLDISTGKILWQTFTLPDNNGQQGGYAGAAIWGSSPSIDTSRGLVYVGTGNLYSAPSYVLDCQKNSTSSDQVNTASYGDECIEPDNHENSILAFDINEGNIKWFRQLGGYDLWYSACSSNANTPNCTPGSNPDADFGEAPMILSIVVNETKHDIVTAVQKSGIAWALDRDTGDIIWSTVAGPGGIMGGGISGAATDGLRVYTNIANSKHRNFTLSPLNKTTTAGGWVAMEANTGEVLWSTANPSNATANGPVTVANGVLFAGSTTQKGNIYALSAEKGKILWSYETGATVYGGILVSNGCIYVGNGFNVTLAAILLNSTPGTSLFAFCLD
ncbi:polyvinylalcohol dehydrogenase-like [Telopea speciosissima]|uniref:polyvinylalcohol dehydrogenase-like n=1 Tax=Telopea speciosissima TaxID=54955 RepID=UPI001CC591B7|nr:polyvinylalcohol dehydrogenase-like [Telopea speciosissima]